MTLLTILVTLIFATLIFIIATWPRRLNLNHFYWYKVCVSQEKFDRMSIVEHSSQDATIKLSQRELLLAMALIQEGRESFGCNIESAKALDEVSHSANSLVEAARGSNLSRPIVRRKIHLVAPAQAQVNAASSYAAAAS